MEEEFVSRRRDVPEQSVLFTARKMRLDLSLAEVLIILTSASYQSIVPSLYDPVSMSIRALILCDLVLRENIYVDEQKNVYVSTTYTPSNPVQDEAYRKIKKSEKPRTVRKWLLLLNGESYSLKKEKYHIKNARKKVGDMLVEKGILCLPKSKGKQIMLLLSKGTTITESNSTRGSKTEIISMLVEFLTSTNRYHESDTLRMHALLCAVSYCRLTEDILLTLSVSASEAAQKKISEIISKYKSELGTPSRSTEWSFFCVLREYLKLGPWL